VSGSDCFDDSELHRAVLRRLVEVAGDQRRLVTPSQLVAEQPIETGDSAEPIGLQTSDLVNALDDLMRSELVERIVPTAGESSYRPTELGYERLRQTRDD
jgi:hypothetical protein